MKQKWRELYFLHWACDPIAIQKTLPEGLFVDTYEDNAYIGIVPFLVKGVRLNFLPPIPGISNFLEVNVRTYVFNKKKEKGILFYSLDANQALAVMAAKFFFKLPYKNACIKFTQQQNGANFCLQRDNSDEISNYKMSHSQRLFLAKSGTLDHFLIERYRLFTAGSSGLYTLTVSHRAYPLAEAKIVEIENYLFRLNNLTISVPTSPIHALYSPGVDVDISTLKRN